MTRLFACNGDAQRIEQLTWILFLKIYDAKEDDWELFDDDYKSVLPEELRWRNWAVDDKSGSALTGDELLKFVNDELFPTLKNLPVTHETPKKKSVVREVFAEVNQYMKNGVLLRQVINVMPESFARRERSRILLLKGLRQNLARR